MNQILQWLSGGDLRSDGASNQVAEFVLANPQVFDDLYAGLSAVDNVIRGRTADALEKIARSRPDLLADHSPQLIQIALDDKVPMVKMHIAMLLGHLAVFEEKVAEITPALLELLEDKSVFVRSWAIASLCILARKYPPEKPPILERIAPLQMDSSIAIRSRARKAVAILADDSAPFPKGWVKSQHLQDI